MDFSIHQASHIGNRKYNQDRVAYAYSNDMLLLVLAECDEDWMSWKIYLNMKP